MTFNVVWLHGASCGGCSMSALDGDGGILFDRLETFGINFLWHQSFSETSGGDVVNLFDEIEKGNVPLHCLCVEGSMLTGPNGTGRFQMLSGTGRSVASWVEGLAKKSDYVVAIGSCAAFGGVPSAVGSATDAKGLQYLKNGQGGLLGATFRSRNGLPVINVSGCAPHPGWIIDTLASLAQGVFREADLDAFGRPLFFASHLAHHGCARNEFYEYKASAGSFSDSGCLMEQLGCKATQAVGDCNLRLWSGGGCCPQSGYTCVACTSPGFEDADGLLATSKIAGIPVGLPVDMPKAWFVALAALSKSATPDRVKKNARSDRLVVPPAREGED